MHHHFMESEKVRYRVHNSLPLVFILRPINPVNALSSYFFKCNVNIVFSPALRSSKRLPSNFPILTFHTLLPQSYTLLDQLHTFAEEYQSGRFSVTI